MSLVRSRAYTRRALNYGGAMSLARYAYNNRNAIASRARQMMFTRTRTGTRTRLTSGVGVTSQYDRKMVYRKKRMPRRKRYAWRKFKNKVTAVSTKSLGSNTVVRNSLLQFDIQLIPTNADTHGLVQVALYPMRQTTLSYLDDVNSMTVNDNRLSSPTSKILFLSGVLDLTMRLQSLLKTSAPTTGNPSLGAEIDVYEVSWNNASGQSGEALDLISAFNIGHTDTGTIPGGTTNLLSTQRGWTPFDCPAALSQHKIKIWKKTKYFLSAEQTATYQIRDPKSHSFSRDNVPGSSSANWPGVTKWLLIVWKPLPGYNYVAAPDNDIIRLNVGVTRKYMYKINQDSTDYDAYGF